jgi:hypothetical protein
MAARGFADVARRVRHLSIVDAFSQAMSAQQHGDLITAQEYRAKAVYATEQAARSTEPSARQSWEFVVENYLYMANELDRKSRL